MSLFMNYGQFFPQTILIPGGHVRTCIWFGKASTLLKFCGWVPNIEKQSLFGVETYDELPTPTLKYTAKREKRRFSDPGDLFHFNRYKGETCLYHLVSSRGTF